MEYCTIKITNELFLENSVIIYYWLYLSYSKKTKNNSAINLIFFTSLKKLLKFYERKNVKALFIFKFCNDWHATGFQWLLCGVSWVQFLKKQNVWRFLSYALKWLEESKNYKTSLFFILKTFLLKRNIWNVLLNKR